MCLLCPHVKAPFGCADLLREGDGSEESDSSDEDGLDPEEDALPSTR